MAVSVPGPICAVCNFGMGSAQAETYEGRKIHKVTEAPPGCLKKQLALKGRSDLVIAYKPKLGTQMSKAVSNTRPAAS